MTFSLRMLTAAVLAATLGCGSSPSEPTPVPDAEPVVDAPPPPLPSRGGALGRAVSPAAGRVKGGRWTVDLQMGAAIEQRPTTRNGVTATSDAPHAR